MKFTVFVDCFTIDTLSRLPYSAVTSMLRIHVYVNGMVLFALDMIIPQKELQTKPLPLFNWNLYNGKMTTGLKIDALQ